MPWPVEPVRIGEGDVRWLKQTWSSQWLREPTADELKGLVDDLLNEKLLAREAEAMGLGAGRHHHPPPAGAEAEVPCRGHCPACRAERGGAQAILCRQRQPFRDAGKALVQAALLQSGASHGR